MKAPNPWKMQLTRVSKLASRSYVANGRDEACSRGWGWRTPFVPETLRERLGSPCFCSTKARGALKRCQIRRKRYLPSPLTKRLRSRTRLTT